MSAAEHERFSDDVGAYLLGALSEAERSAFERHLAVCHVCGDEVERLRVAADALPRSVEQFEAPPSLKAAVMAEVHGDRKRRSRRTWAERLGLGAVSPRIAAATAAVVLALGLAGGVILSGIGGDDSGGSRSIAATVDSTRVGEARATLVVPDGDGPGALHVRAMPQPRRGQVYEVWLRRGDRIVPGPLFSVDRNGSGTAAVPADLGDVDEVMVTRERAGGARQPTEAPVISVGV